jgi:hypothetical protein
MGKDTQMAIFEGLNRVQAVDFIEEDGVLKAHAFEMEEHMPLKNDKQFKATVDTIKRPFRKYLANEKRHRPD